MSTRTDRVRKTLMKEISDIIRRDVKDPRISGIISVTDLEVASDFSYAKVYVSIYGNEEEKAQTLEALEENAPRVRGEVGRRVRLRLTPEIIFIKDDSLERGSRITDLLNKISKGEL